MKAIAIVQARLGSTRLPGKGLADVCGQPALWHLFAQLAYARKLDRSVLATTNRPTDDPLARYGTDQGWTVYRGDEHDVLDLYYRAAQAAGCEPGDLIVRVGGYDILVDPAMVDRAIELYLAGAPRVQYVCSNRVPRNPYGGDVEAFSFGALEQAWREATLPEEREHVSPFIRNQPERFPDAEFHGEEDNSRFRLSIDYAEDLAFNRELIGWLMREGPRPFHMQQVVDCIRKHHLQHPRLTT